MTNQVKLRDVGDDIEIDGCRRFGLDAKFPNYEIFWRLHVVPATNRTVNNVTFHEFIDPVVEKMAMANHGIFCDLVTAEENLVRVRNDDYGNRFQNCLQSLQAGGDAMQKCDSLQRKIIQGLLAARLNRSIIVWTAAQWKKSWENRYIELAAYRNYLTHTNSPQVMLVGPPNGEKVPLVPHEEHFLKYESLSWREQKERYQTHCSEWDTLKAVCERMHDANITWLNDVYGKVLKALAPLLVDEDYHDLWGLDTAKYGRRVTRNPPTSPHAPGPRTGTAISASKSPPPSPPGIRSTNARSG